MERSGKMVTACSIDLTFRNWIRKMMRRRNGWRRMRAIYPTLAYATVLPSLYSRCAGGVAAMLHLHVHQPHCFEQPVA
jgi:hypothetical protein